MPFEVGSEGWCISVCDRCREEGKVQNGSYALNLLKGSCVCLLVKLLLDGENMIHHIPECILLLFFYPLLLVNWYIILVLHFCSELKRMLVFGVMWMDKCLH